jgi:RNase P protein component
MGAADVVVRSLPSAYELSYVELLAEFEKVIPRVATTTKER